MKNNLTVIVCGGRDYNDYMEMALYLDAIHSRFKIKTIVNGAARGADSLSTLWAIENKVYFKEYPADWSIFGKSAGYRRNYDMLVSSNPDLVICFEGGKGTSNMKNLALKKEIPVFDVAEYKESCHYKNVESKQTGDKNVLHQRTRSKKHPRSSEKRIPQS